MATFAFTVIALPTACATISAVYLAQYRTARKSLIPVLVTAHFVAVVMIIASYAWLCLVHVRSSLLLYPGWVVFALGSGLFWYAVRCHPACLVPDDQCGVVRVGPYQLIRHPIYAGGLLAALGLAGVAPSWQVLAAWAELAVCLAALVWVEERELCGRIGEAYHAYRSRTKLLVPRVL